MVQPSQNRRRLNSMSVGEMMPGGPRLVRRQWRFWQAGAQTGMRAPAIVVRYPCAKDPSEMSLVEGDQPVQTLPTHRADQLLTEGVRLRSPTGVLSTRRPIDAIARSTPAA